MHNVWCDLIRVILKCKGLNNYKYQRHFRLWYWSLQYFETKNKKIKQGSSKELMFNWLHFLSYPLISCRSDSLWMASWSINKELKSWSDQRGTRWPSALSIFNNTINNWPPPSKKNTTGKWEFIPYHNIPKVGKAVDSALPTRLLVDDTLA